MKKWFNLYLAATFAALVLFGCSKSSNDGDGNGGGDITYKRSIDLSSLPEASQAKLQDVKYNNGKIYAAFQYFNGWVPAGNSKILELDEAGNVLRTFESNFMNVVEIEIRGNNLFVLDMGDYFAVDGGITKIDLTSATAQTILDGATAGADPAKIEFVSDNEAYLLMLKGFNDDLSEDSYVATFNLNNNSLSPVDELGAKNSVKTISYNQNTNALWLGSGSNVYKYSLANKEIDFNATTQLPISSIKSAGATTVTIETDYTAGKYGVISNNKYSSKKVIDSDADVGFADGNFYILECKDNGKLTYLTADGEIIKQVPFENSAYFNPHGVCGNGNGKIFVGSYEDLTISVFEAKN
ncbi:MAG: hypothetical protein LBH98_06210 [Chitinispirillales bacterium]|jgi:hypothetical protein|nr:hypothetical protein [Chitinispirillales bacterium]